MPPTTQTTQSSESSPPLISVCIPAYNNEDFIAITLESVLNQTHQNFEIIITDDQSSDRTVAVIETFTDPRIRLIRNEVNLGIGANWNKATSFATGKYIKVLCGDDLLYPDCLSRQVRALESEGASKVVLAICASDVINAKNEIVLHRKPRLGTGQLEGKNLVRRCIRYGTNLIGEPAVGLFRRESLAKAAFDSSNPYMLDLAFWAQLLRDSDAFVDGARLAAFRISGGSVSAKVGLKQAEYFRRFARAIYADSAYKLTRSSLLLGYLLSLQWCILRNLLINFHARKTAVPQR